MSLDAIGIISRDPLQSIRFYGLLGVEFKELGEGHFEGTTPSGVRIMLDSVDLMKKLNPDWQEPTGVGIILCFRQDAPRLVDEVHGQLTRAGFASVTEPWDAFWGQRYGSVLDPDGNQIDLFAPM